MEWLKEAKEKLNKKGGSFDRYAAVMKDRVREKLLYFCEQDGEFAQAVAQGGSFEDCMKKVAGAVKGNQGIEDIAAYEEAVAFFFPGARIRATMTIDLIGDAGSEEAEWTGKKNGIVLDLKDFL